jgi:hypothetical protein
MARRKRLLLALGIVLVVLGGAVVTLAFMVRHEPAFYARGAVEPGSYREQQSKTFVTRFLDQLYNPVKMKQKTWQANFTETQINSFLEETFLAEHWAERLLPEGISGPRVALEQDRLRIAFRYGSPPWSTIISLDFRVWLAPKEPNVVVLQLNGIHAGALPISSQTLMEGLFEGLKRQSIEVSYHRHENKPTAVLRFHDDQSRPGTQLLHLELAPGKLTLAGRAVAH